MIETDEDNLESPGTYEPYRPESPLVPPGEPLPGPRKLDLLDVLLVFARRKWVIMRWIAAGLIIAIIAILRAPELYKAEGVIMPPQQEQSSSALLSQLGALGAFAGLGANLGKNPSDLYIAILRTNLVMDNMVDQFGLQKVYGIRDRQGAAGMLRKRSKFVGDKVGMIQVYVEDKDPHRAMELVNGFTNQLFEQNNRLIIGSARQRREFYQGQLDQEKDRLADAEVALKQTQLSTGVLQLGGQAQNLIAQEASLEANITSHEVQLAALGSSSTADNPDVVRLRTELNGLREQLQRMQHGTGGDIMTQHDFPTAGLEYIRKERDVEYHQTLYDLLARQLEAARIDEAKASPDVQIVDPPLLPENKSWPKPFLFLLIGLVLGGLCGCTRVVVLFLYDYADSDPRLSDRFHAVKQALRPGA